MRVLFAAFLLLISLAVQAAGWTNQKGFNFRATSGFVVDGTNETYVLQNTAYPTTTVINGESVTYGWESGTVSSADRSTAAGDAPELSGVNFDAPGNGNAVFRIDLPATGAYTVRVGAGDAGGTNDVNFILEDGTTAFVTSTDKGSTAADSFYDAALNLWTSGTAWHSSNVAVSHTFTSTILRFVLVGSSTEYEVIAHVDVTPAVASSCTHAGLSAAGAWTLPNGSSGSYRLKNGSFGTPDCSTVSYFQPAVGNFGVN